MATEQQMSPEKETVYETVRDAVEGIDAPMESGHKVASAALVGATYPIVLVVLLIAGLIVAYFTAWRTNDLSKNGPVTEVVR